MKKSVGKKYYYYHINETEKYGPGVKNITENLLGHHHHGRPQQWSHKCASTSKYGIYKCISRNEHAKYLGSDRLLVKGHQSARKRSKDSRDHECRYAELVDLVRFGKGKLNIFTEKEYYEGHIDPENGADWNQSAPIDTKPSLQDLENTVSDYLAWKMSTLLKQQNAEDERLGK